MADIHVMFLSAGLSAGGAEKNTVTIANQLLAFARVSVVCLYPGGVNAEFLHENVKLIRADKARILSSFGFMIATLRKEKPKVLICNKDDVAVLGYLASKLALVGTKVVARVANKPVYYYQESSIRKGVTYSLLWFLYRRCELVISVSESLREELLQVYGLKENRIRVIYNPPGIVPKNSTVKLEAKSHTSFKLVTIGRLVEQKNHHLFLDIIKSLSTEYECEGFIVGSGRLRSELEQHAISLGLTDNVHFVPYVDNPVVYLKQADCFLLTSRYEGLPGGLMHALISGVNIVSADCEHGAAEILDDGRFGQLVKSSKTEDFVSAVKDVINHGGKQDNPSLAEHLNKFDISVITDKWLKLIKEL